MPPPGLGQPLGPASRPRAFSVEWLILAALPMPRHRRTPYGNLTAVLVVVALLEFVFHRLLGRMFLSTVCRGGLGCLVPRIGPFFLFLSGVLAVGIISVGLSGQLLRGELYPRGPFRFTLGLLSAVFVTLVAVSLFQGRTPERYLTELETSFAFVILLVDAAVLGTPPRSLQGAGALRRAKLGLVAFSLPHLLHVASAVGARAGWAREGSPRSNALILLGEAAWLLAGISSPTLLLVGRTSRARLATALGFAAGASAFFFVALLGRYDLVQAIALYGLRIELPHAVSPLGFAYALALFGFATTTTALLLKAGPTRLTGLGLALVCLAGYQTSSPVELSLALCGLLAVATGITRGESARPGSPTGSWSMPAPGQWRALLGSLTVALADRPPGPEMDPALIEVVPGDEPDSDDSRIRAVRRGHPVSLRFVRTHGQVDSLRAEVGTPGDDVPDAAIESHERWLARAPEDRLSMQRIRTGDGPFDRKLGVYGKIALTDPHLRRRLMRHPNGSFTFWNGRAARYLALRDTRGGKGPGSLTDSGQLPMPAILHLVDTLVDVLESNSSPPSPSSTTPFGPPS